MVRKANEQRKVNDHTKEALKLSKEEIAQSEPKRKSRPTVTSLPTLTSLTSERDPIDHDNIQVSGGRRTGALEHSCA